MVVQARVRTAPTTDAAYEPAIFPVPFPPRRAQFGLMRFTTSSAVTKLSKQKVRIEVENILSSWLQKSSSIPIEFSFASSEKIYNYHLSRALRRCKACAAMPSLLNLDEVV